jgi:peptidoglycan-associated lipoprotein
MMNQIIKLVSVALAVLLLAGCTGSGTRSDGGAPVSGSGAETDAAARPTTLTLSDGTVVSLGNPNEPLKTRIIFFEFDRSDILPEYRYILDAHAKHLIENRQLSVTLEGNGDERGSREYNIALGERRANSVKHYLTAAGVPSSQIMTISYGEERPYVEGTGEYAWSKNRRVEIVY